MDLKQTYNRIANDWHADHADDTWWIAPMESFLEQIPKNSLVLDVGCAGGTKARFMMERGMRVIGIDIAEKFIDIAKHENPGGDFRVLDMLKVGSMSERFDAICAQASLLHIPKQQIPLVMAGFSMVLKSGGKLAIAVKEKRPHQPEEQMVVEDDYGYSYERFFSYFSEEEMRDACAKAGIPCQECCLIVAGKTNWLHIVGVKK